MKAKKIYGNTIYVNDEKVTLTENSVKVLNFDASVFDGTFSPSVISALKSVSESDDDLSIVKIADLTKIIDINSEMQGVKFTGSAFIHNDKCFFIKVRRSDKNIDFEFCGEKAEKVYEQLISNK